MASVRLEYEISYVNDAEETENYEVTESYRVRYTQQRMYLLNYDRKVDRVFDPGLDIFTKKGVELGILNTEVEYRKNDEENIVGFVQNGELWCYDVAQGPSCRRSSASGKAKTCGALTTSTLSGF